MLDIGVKFEGAGEFEWCILQVMDNSDFESADYYTCVMVENPQDDDEVGDIFLIASEEVGCEYKSNSTTGTIEHYSTPATFTTQPSEMETAIILGLVQ